VKISRKHGPAAAEPRTRNGCANDASDALAAIDAFTLDIVLLDIGLPGMNGGTLRQGNSLAEGFGPRLFMQSGLDATPTLVVDGRYMIVRQKPEDTIAPLEKVIKMVAANRGR
jgi:hypothetical protein